MPANNLNRNNEEGIFSHIYNKGVEQKIIFNDDEDYKVFLGFIKDYLSHPQDPESIKKDFTVNGRLFRGTPHQPKNYFNQVELVAYCLMPDHFHLLLHQKTHGSLESFIRSLCTRYSIHFNKKYHRSGALFEGPYKSVQIKNEPELLHLTRYLHRPGAYSSYPEYLGERETSWVKPETVILFLNQGNAGYQKFVEEYEFDQKEKEFLAGIILEAETAHLEKRKPAESLENAPQQLSSTDPELPSESAEIPSKSPEVPFQSSENLNLPPNSKPLQNSKPLKRLPEFLAATVIFLLLVAIGITNIMASANSSQPLILGIATTNLSIASSSKPSPSPTRSPTHSILKTEEISTPSAEVAKPKIMLIVKIDGGTKRVNIRQKPTASSATVGKAKDGQTYEFVSTDSGWYEVKLAEGSTGFISEQYIKIGETSN